MKKDNVEKKQERLSREELKLISEVLYRSAWTGEQWQQVTLLINKIARILDELK